MAGPPLITHTHHTEHRGQRPAPSGGLQVETRRYAAPRPSAASHQATGEGQCTAEGHLLENLPEDLLHLHDGMSTAKLVTIRSQISGLLLLNSQGSRPLTMGSAALIPGMTTDILPSSPRSQNFLARKLTMVITSFSPSKALSFS